PRVSDSSVNWLHIIWKSCCADKNYYMGKHILHPKILKGNNEKGYALEKSTPFTDISISICMLIRSIFAATTD
ncbi:hypothetical protein ACJX0J_035787, partial [Zea mays]